MQIETSSRRRWRQFSLRTLLAATFLCAVGLAFWITLIQPYRKEAEIIARLIERRAVVTTESDGPGWLLAIAGKDFCQRIVQVEVDDPNFDDADLILLATAPKLRSFMMGERCKITAGGLRHLEQAKNLTDLMISNPAVANEALAYLGRMKQLEHLLIGGVFTDDGVNHLSGLRGLQTLSLRSPRITNEALPALSTLTELRQLRLHGKFSDAGMVHLLPLVHLETLSCTGDPARAPMVAAVQKSAYGDFLETPLADIASYLTHVNKVPFRVDANALKDANLRPDLPLTTNIDKAKVRDFFHQVLGPKELGWMITPDAVVITTQEAADRSRPNTIALQRTLKNLKDLEVEW